MGKETFQDFIYCGRTVDQKGKYCYEFRPINDPDESLRFSKKFTGHFGVGQKVTLKISEDTFQLHNIHIEKLELSDAFSKYIAINSGKVKALQVSRKKVSGKWQMIGDEIAELSKGLSFIEKHQLIEYLRSKMK